jgi:glycosyltransferase involved in cell wall biosynthesis
MKVLIVNDCPPGLSGSGGVETHIRQLKEALTDRGVEVAILASQPRGVSDRMENDLFLVADLNSPPLRKHPLRNYHNQQTTLEKAEAIIRQFKPDVINVHNFINSGVLRMLRENGPLVKSLHDCRPFCIKPPPNGHFRLVGDTEEFCDLTFGRKCWSRCYAHAGHTPKERIESWSYFPANLRSRDEMLKVDRIVTYGDYLKELAGRLYEDSDRIHIVHHFTDAEEAAAGFEVNPHEEPVFLFAGRFSPEKAPLHIFQALEKIPEVPCRVILAGSGILQDDIEACARRASPKHQVELPGFVNQEQLYDLYRRSSVLLFPSIGSEGCPLVGLESMYFGNTAIGYDTGGAGEWLVDGKTGIRVDSGDIDGLAQAMTRLATNPDERLRLRRQARDFVSRKFRREAHITQLMDVYKQAMGDRESPVYENR